MKSRTYINYFTLVSTITLALLALFVLVPQSESLQSGMEAVRSADKLVLLLGIFLMFLTYAAAALTLKCIALRNIAFLPILLVQFASGFASKLVPAGIGGFALNTRYLQKQRHSVIQASSVMAFNGILGFLGHNLILIGGLLFYRDSLGKIFQGNISAMFVLTLLLLLIGLPIVLAIVLKKRMKGTVRDLRRTMQFYRSKPQIIVGGFFGAMAVTVLFTSILYCSALSLGVSMSWPEVFIAYTVMSIGAAVTPTPGGIGGAEAALTGILIALGHDTATAFAVALIFRFITFWLPIIPGYAFFQLLLHRQSI